MFHDDKLPPNAILIEYISNIQEIDRSKFPSEYLRELSQILEDIHLAGVYHGDPRPRNMMVSKDQGKALWIDFDSAQYFPESLSASQKT